MIKLDGILEAFKLYGFIIISEEQREFLDYLRAVGVIHLLNVRKLGNHIILEVNVYGCERECDLRCRDGNGLVSDDCYGECVDMCIMERLNTIVRILTKPSR